MDDGGGGALDVEDRELIETTLQDQRAREGLFLATAWVLITTIAFIAYAAFVWTAFQIEHGYPSIAVAPSAPGPFISQRYTAQWVFTYALVINYAASAFLALALASPGRISGIYLHRLVTRAAVAVNVTSPIALLVMYLWLCNNARATMNSMGNDVAWCCVHSHSSTLANQLCGAINPLCPGITQSSLSIASPMLWTIIAGLAGAVISFAHISFNKNVTKWRLWSLRG